MPDVVETSLADREAVNHDLAYGSGGSWLVAQVSGPDGPAFSLPAGTITFLLADVARGSRHWDDAPEPAAAGCELLLDDAIGSHGGVRPADGGESGQVVGAFSRASDAVAAALAAQRSLSLDAWSDDATLRVRIAVHTGEAQLRSEGAFFAEAVAHCGRLLAIGHGGQVLVSAATASLLGDRLPEGAHLVDLGTHRLRDLGRPEQVWQLAHPDLALTFPALRSLDVFRHNLPVQLTSLLGRDGDVEAVGRLLTEERLVTLTGSGGVGKSRMALAVAAEEVEHFGGGVWLVELAAVTDPDSVATTALAAVGAYQSPGAAPTELLSMALGREPSLLVLDNCEHLIEGCARLAAGLLSANPMVRVLATSRESLGVPGEVSWQVPALDAPPPEYAPAVSTLPQYDAVRLFIDRARRARPSFAVSEHNAPAVARICQRLDGIPLALELAAACCRQLSAERIADDLDNRFRLLTGGARTVLPRHRTLGASIDWSHDRLDSAEAITFRRLSVFAGPFPLEAAEAIVSAGGAVQPEQVFDHLSRLVDKSLVIVQDGMQSEPRYRLLETLRAYALDRLRSTGELNSLRDIHARWCLDWLEERKEVLHLDAIVGQVETMHDNLRAALDWSLDQPATGLRLLGCLARAWQVCGRPADAMAAVDRLMTDENAQSWSSDWIATALPASILVELVRGFGESVALLSKTERLATQLGRSYEAALARWLASYDAESCEAACDEAQRHGDAYFFPLTRISSIEMQIDADPLAAARLDYDDLVAACCGSTLLIEHAAYVRAQAERAPGNIRRCIELATELTRSRSGITVAGAINVLSGSALLARDEDALILAVETAEERLGTTSPTWELAAHRLGLLRGKPSRVERQLHQGAENFSPVGLHLIIKEAIDAGGASVGIEAARTHTGRGPYSQAMLACCEAAAAGDVDRWHDALQVAAEHGLRLLVVDALEGIASAAGRSESWVESLRLLGAAARLREECEYLWRFRTEQDALDQAIAAARQQLQPADADDAQLQGRTMSWPEAVHYARRARGERKRPRHGWAALTPTEGQVVALVADGLTNPQIATRLLMGRATVKTHLEHIFAKLGVASRSELAAQAARRDSSHARRLPPTER
jgi:predicted ATPase/class 3 adenylate cyclase/DNA-binding CsgD family transcriptional regulator